MAGEIGYGTTIGYSDTINGTYTDVSLVTEVMPPDIECNDVDKTHLLSASYFREFAAGMGNAGEIEFKILFAKAMQTTLYGLIRTDKYWRIRFPLVGAETTQTSWACAGYLKGIKNVNPLDDKMEATVKIKLSGKPVFTEGS